MSSQVESTVKALVEYESELDRIEAEMLKARGAMAKEAEALAEAAKARAIAKAERQASERLATVKQEAEAEAKAIGERGKSSQNVLESSISRRRTRAVEGVVGRLLGEPR